MSEKAMEIYQERYEDEIDLAELFKILIKNKFIIIVTTVIITVISGIIGIVQSASSKTAVGLVAFNYKEFQNGKNPDGSLFNKNQILSRAVLNKVYSNYPQLESMDITIEDIVKGVKIEGITPNNINKIAEASLKKGEQFNYYPSSYKINLKVTGDEKLDRYLLNSILDEYTKYFYYKYNSKNYFGKINIADSSAYDYPDYLVFLTNTVSTIKNQISYNEKSGFVSKRTNLSYEDISKVLDNIQKMDINKVASTVDVYNITKNKDELKSKYEHKIKNYELEKDKKLGEARVVDEMLKKYKPQERKMLLPSIGETGIKISTEEEYYSSLINKSLEAKIRVQEIDSEVRYYQEKIENMKEYPVDKQDELNLILDKTIVKINNLVDKLNVMNDEYSERYFSDTIKKVVPVKTEKKSKALLILAVGTVLGLFMGIFGAFAKEFFKGLDLKK